MSIPEKGNVLIIPVCSGDSEQASVEISWSQSFRTRNARYYIVRAQNQSKENADVLLYIQDYFYQQEGNNSFIGKLPGATKLGNSWVVSISDHFQYGQKNKTGDSRWVVLHDKGNKPYQHRFMITTIQGAAAEWAKTLAKAFGAGDIADAFARLGNSFIGDYLHTF
ncbi:hypothetical protein S7711_01611 [Stachybotrys chartarum IBT 7711]|uniref:Uncharacterized protein n=1 Tax=Stachybotrys chartarum (strain CBS 109288 / IBT 7711) TaxID=1280523 RepID=A0A084BC85_STACB|nr:hypothetical protein S7711_01611 [Stachybotrys chartarum IBT 7711]KFA56562.1 hypothetical protein S40293_01044 [Stachybotrys chartarum IBT 40293]KFA80027.1 hypothetical protein S40288_01832 [Stachybotrys chartarum IBT 40288]